MKRRWAGLVFVLASAGAGLSAYLARQHFRLLYGMAEGESLCSVGGRFNCDAVSLSPHSEVFGIPLASIGLGLYFAWAALAFVALFVNRVSARKILLAVFGTAVLAVFADVYLGFVLVTKIKAYCLFCLLTYGINLLVAIVLWLGFGGRKGLSETVKGFAATGSWLSHGEGEKRSPALAIAAVVAALSLALTAAVHAGYAKPKGVAQVPSREVMRAKLTEWLEREKPLAADFQLDASPQYGAANAPLTLVEFSDFECPYCQKAATMLKPLLEAYHDKVKFVFKHYPLDQACNPKITREMHTKACLFAKVSFCAGQQGDFWKMHDKLFLDGSSINYGSLPDQSKAMGYDWPTMEQCLASQAASDAVRRDLELGGLLGVSGTPSLFLNGRRLPGLVQPQILRELFDMMLEPTEKNTAAVPSTVVTP